MEEPELRVGGWEKEKGKRTFRRLFNLILILIIAFAFIGPSIINYNPAYVPSDSLYLANGMWNGPFDVQYSKQFSGHMTISSVTYETTLDKSGELRIISMSSFINLEEAYPYLSMYFVISPFSHSAFFARSLLILSSILILYLTGYLRSNFFRN